MKKILTLCLLIAVVTGAAAQDNTRRYAIKSGIARTVSFTGGHRTDGMQYFDDYGAVENLSQTIEVPGLVTYDAVTVTKGDKIWLYSQEGEKKSAAKMSDNPLPDLNFLDLTDEVAAKYQVEELGEDEYKGYPCTKYSYVTIQNRRKCSWTAWVYKGFCLKYEAKIGRRDVLFEVVEFQENVPVPAEKFEIPE